MSYVESLRQSFRPVRITTLFIGESTPRAGTFFYEENSKLFYAMQRAFRSQEDFLEHFKNKGFYLDDLAPEPINGLAAKERIQFRRNSISSLTDRLKIYRPDAIVIVMRAIKPMILEAMQKAGLSFEPYCTPFPTFGNQTRFHNEMTEIIPNLPVIDSSKEGTKE